MGNGNTFGANAGVGSTIALLEAQLPAVLERRLRVEAELAAVTAEEEAVTRALEGLRLLSDVPVDGGGEPHGIASLPPAAAAPTPTPTEALPAPDSAAGHSAPSATPAPDAPTAPTAGTRAAAKKAPARKPVPAKNAAPAPDAKVPAPRARKSAKRAAVTTEPKAASKRVSTAGKTESVPTAPTGGKAPVKEAAPQAAGARRRQVADADSVLGLLSAATGPLRAREVTELLGLDTLDANVNAIRTRLERLTKDGRAQRSGRGLYTSVAG